MRTPNYVVTDSQYPDGIGGTRHVEYHYQDLRIDRHGRGLQGFAQITEIDIEAQTKTITEYNQQFPKTGTPSQTQQIYFGGAGGDKIINHIINGYKQIIQTGIAGYYYKIVPESIDETSYHLNTSLTASSAFAKTYTEYDSHDSYGNAQHITVRISNINETESQITTTSNTYLNIDNATTYRLGLVQGAVVSRYKNGGWQTNERTQTSFEYDAKGYLLSETIEPGAGAPLEIKTVYARDPWGNINKTTVCADDYATCGDTGVTGPATLPYRIITTTFGHDGRFPINTSNALNQTESYVYEPAFGNIIAQTGPNNLTTTFSYDAFGRQTAEHRPDGNSTSIDHAWCGSCPSHGYYTITTTVSGSAPVIEYFDQLSRQIRAQSTGFDGTATYSDTVYDHLGRTIKVSEPYYAGSNNIYWTETAYDGINRITQITPADGSPVITTLYNPFSSIRQQTVNAVLRQETTLKNIAGQTISTTDADGTVMHYDYDVRGNLLTTQVAERPDTLISIQYDRRSRKISMTDPSMGSWQYQYNAYGELIWQQDANSNITTMGYDLLGRMISRTDGEGTSNWTYGDNSSYTSNNRNTGKLIAVNGPGGNYSKQISYDALGRLSSTTVTLDTIYHPQAETYVTTQSYDNYSRVSQIQYPSVNGARFTIQRNYNTYGHLRSISSPAELYTYWEAMGVNARGLVTNENFAITAGSDPVSSSYKTINDANGWINRIMSSSDAAGTFQDMQYEFDDVGNIRWRKDHTQNGKTENFSYDVLDRLTSINIDGNNTTAINYDRLGNITYKSDVGHYKYASDCSNGFGPHAVCEVRDQSSNGNLLHSYNYDSNGNMVARNGGTVSYTSFNKPYQFNESGTIVTFLYSAERSRIFKSSAGLTRAYLGLGATGGTLYEHERLSNGTEKHVHFIYATGSKPIAVHNITVDGSTETDSLHFMHGDHLGSVEVLTDHTGQVTLRKSFDAWGKRRNTDWTANTSGSFTSTEPAHGNLGFTGHEMIPEMGLIHMNGRVYDPTLGRFLSADPHVQFEKDIQSYNRYSYVSNNPLRYTDPSGYLIRKVLRSISPKVASIISTALNFIPGCQAWCSAAFNAMHASANGATPGQVAFAFAVSYAGGKLGKGSVNPTDGVMKIHHTMIESAVSSAFSGAAYALKDGGNLRRGILQGAAKGAAMGAIRHSIHGDYEIEAAQGSQGKADQGHVNNISQKPEGSLAAEDNVDDYSCSKCIVKVIKLPDSQQADNEPNTKSLNTSPSSGTRGRGPIPWHRLQDARDRAKMLKRAMSQPGYSLDISGQRLSNHDVTKGHAIIVKTMTKMTVLPLSTGGGLAYGTVSVLNAESTIDTVFDAIDDPSAWNISKVAISGKFAVFDYGANGHGALRGVEAVTNVILDLTE